MKRIPHCAHWGAFDVLVDGGQIRGIEAFPLDPAPSPILESIRDWLDPKMRIAQPMVREGWLDKRDDRTSRCGRGRDRFVPTSWEKVTRLVADEIERVRTVHGNDSIFAGSYGWGSAGRFHHAQSQVRRLMNLMGGYTGHTETYSVGAGAVIMRHVLGDDSSYYGRATGLDTAAEHSEILLVFGALSPRTAQVESGGIAKHALEDNLRRIKAKGVRVILVSPRRDDIPEWVGAEWWPIVPGTDSALLIALAFEIVCAGQHDADFLSRCCSGSEAFLSYLKGTSDGIVKSSAWAESITDIHAAKIRALARDIATKRTLITMSWSLQRAIHGEQPWWAAVGLASVAGQMGRPGGGVTFGVASLGGVGAPQAMVKPPALPQGIKPNKGFIPVARIADMLLNPGRPFPYNGATHRYPDARMIYWAGGNPFHHHQDLGRLEQAWAVPETIVVQDIVWTPTARRADIVLPACSSLERNDIAGSRRSDHVFAMRQAVAPLAQSRSDFGILSEIAAQLGVEQAFTEGRDEMAWIRHLYEETRADSASRFDLAMPDFETFWERGHVEVPTRGMIVHLADFRRDPEHHKLKTSTGKIILYSAEIEKLGLADCPPHPAWILSQENLRSERARAFPFHLITAQPAGRLHSQLDFGCTSMAGKTAGRETVRVNPDDARRLGLADGDTAMLQNDRGRCLAGVRVTPDVRSGVAVLPTGAWHLPYETSGASLDIAGNPNVLTLDVGSSQFSQGCAAQSCLVSISRYDGNAPTPDMFSGDEAS